MLSSGLFLASCGILFFILKYRVHVHVTYIPPTSPARQRVKGRRAEAGELTKPPQPTAMTRPAISKVQETTPIQDLQSALVNLGAKPHRAKAAAEHVTRNWPDAGFDRQFREALREVQAA